MRLWGRWSSTSHQTATSVSKVLAFKVGLEAVAWWGCYCIIHSKEYLSNKGLFFLLVLHHAGGRGGGHTPNSYTGWIYQNWGRNCKGQRTAQIKESKRLLFCIWLFPDCTVMSIDVLSDGVRTKSSWADAANGLFANPVRIFPSWGSWLPPEKAPLNATFPPSSSAPGSCNYSWEHMLTGWHFYAFYSEKIKFIAAVQDPAYHYQGFRHNAWNIGLTRA